MIRRSIFLLISCLAVLPGNPLIPENRERLVIVGAGYSQEGLAGLELGLNVRWGNLVISSYYDAPANQQTANLSYLTEGRPSDADRIGEYDDGILYINARWMAPAYRSLYLTMSVGLVSERHITIYRDRTYDYRVGVLSYEQQANAGMGLTWRFIKNLAVNCEYNYRLGALVSLNYYWILNEPEKID